MRLTRVSLLAISSLASAQMVMTTPVTAQDIFDVGIPEYTPDRTADLKGKAYLFSANIDASMMSVSNAFRENQNEDSDIVFILNPEMTFRSNSENRFSGRIGIELENKMYQDFSFNDQTSFQVAGDGSFDLSETDSVDGLIQIGQNEIGIGGFSDDQDDGAASPTQYDFQNLELGWNHFGEEWFGGVLAAYEALDYDNVRRFDNSLIINDDRDRSQWGMGIEAGRVMQNRQRIGLAYRHNEIEYDQRIDSTLLQSRDSSADMFLATYHRGSRSERQELNAAVGIEARNFDSVDYDDIDTLIFDVDARAELSPSTDLLIRADREIKETTLNDTSAAIALTVKAEIRTQISPKVKLRGMTVVQNQDFQVNTTLNNRENRSDDRFQIYGEAAYQVVSDIWVYGGASLINRGSSRASSEYDDQQLFIGVKSEY